MHTVDILASLVENHIILAYLLVFLIIIVEGEITAILSGIFVFLGAFNFWIALVVISAGGVVKTLLGYFLGTFFRKHFNKSKFLIYMEKKVSSVMPRSNKSPFWSIFVSKFLIGLNNVVIIFCGYRRINFKTYLKAELISTILWVPLMLSLGYFFSYTALSISEEISKFLLVIVLFIFGFFLLDKFITLLYYIFENLGDNDNVNEQ